MDNGYIVVSLLYRLVQYGKDNTEITSNTTTWQTQIDDIDAAIQHIKTNFPGCLGLNANSIQELGESAGGHLALMWAYSKNTISSSYIKSVVSCYAPTNMQQFGDVTRNNPLKYNCGAPYLDICLNLLPYVPHYLLVHTANTMDIYNTYSPMMCVPGVSCFLGSNTLQNDFRVIDSSYNILQSAVATVITNPSSNVTLGTYSPKNALNSSRVIPTYILHGNNDLIVPYNKATAGMKTALTNTGGLIDSINTTGIISYNFNQNNKHLIQTVPGANHGWAGLSSGNLDNIRHNIIYG